MSASVVAPSPSNVVAAGATWPALCTVVVALRFYTRRSQHAKLLLDDWLTIPALLLTIGMGATLLVADITLGVHRKSLGYPTPPPPDPEMALISSSFQLRTTRQILWAFELMQIPALGAVKLSFIFFFRRIFVTGVGRVFRSVTTIIIVIITAWVVALFVALLVACRGDFAAWWVSVDDLNTKCIDTLELENAFAISDFILDLIVIILPIPQIWKLHMTLSRKFALTGIFSLGALSVAASITRMVIFIEAVQGLKKDFKTSGDSDLVTTAGLYWSMIESGLGLLAACLPTLYALLKSRGVKRTVDSFQTSTSLSFRRLTAEFERRNDSMGSQIEMVPSAAGLASVNACAVKKPERVVFSPKLETNQILIQKSVEQTDNLV